MHDSEGIHHRAMLTARNDMEILSCITGNSGGMELRDICLGTGIAYGTVRGCLRGLRSAGVVQRVKHGFYTLTEI